MNQSTGCGRPQVAEDKVAASGAGEKFSLPSCLIQEPQMAPAVIYHDRCRPASCSALVSENNLRGSLPDFVELFVGCRGGQTIHFAGNRLPPDTLQQQRLTSIPGFRTPCDARVDGLTIGRGQLVGDEELGSGATK